MADIFASIEASLSTIWIPFEKKKKKNVEKLEKVLRRKKNLLEFPQETLGLVQWTAAWMRADPVCFIPQRAEHKRIPVIRHASDPGWRPPSPEGPARPTAITTLPSILHSPLTNLSLHYVSSPKFPVVSFGMFPRVQSVGQKVRTCMRSLWHRLQISIFFFPNHFRFP